MLTIFPYLLNLQMAAPFLLRIVLGGLFIKYGYSKIVTDHASAKILDLFYKKQNAGVTKNFSRALGAVELICGALLLAGLFTQIAAGVIAALMIAALVIKITKKDEVLKDDYDFYSLALVIALSLLMLGPGIFSFDLPL